MNTGWTVDSLRAFEQEIADAFNRGEIKSPVHLAGGNEQQLIDIFKAIRSIDWVCCTWRSHYHCLLKGVPSEQVRQAILAGRSIALCFPEHNIISSAMVGGIVPIALGLAWAVKRRGINQCVFCFIGDMAASTGLVAECSRYASGHELPLQIIVEDNGLSVSTDTNEAWGKAPWIVPQSYHYTLDRPHVGTGTWVHLP